MSDGQKIKPKVRLGLTSYSEVAPRESKLGVLAVFDVAETLNKEPRKRTESELNMLKNLVIDKRFFSEFQQKYGDAGLKDLLRRCYHE